VRDVEHSNRSPRAMLRLHFSRHQGLAHAVLLAACLVLISSQAHQHVHAAEGHTLSLERVVFQTKHGDLEFALYPQVHQCTTRAVRHVYYVVASLLSTRIFISRCRWHL
jgi:hypothetical protein